MGREVRRVPPGWEHPRDLHGYVPLLDGEDFVRHLAYFVEHADEWRQKYGSDLGGETRPDPADYMPSWSVDKKTAWCIYENVSEGTPWSPVFTEPEALQRWLVEEKGYAPDAAARFLVTGYAPSFTIASGVMRDGIASS